MCATNKIIFKLLEIAIWNNKNRFESYGWQDFKTIEIIDN